MLRIKVARQLGDFRLDVRFEAPELGVTSLFGASGTGKSSLLQAIAGLLRPERGHISIGELTFFDSEHRIDMPVQDRGIGYVFQDSRLFPHLSVEQNLRYGQTRSRGRERRISFDDAISVLAIDQLLERRVHDLSGGEKQRVAIGRALLAQPRLLLLDEPLASVDDARKDEILACLERLRAQVPVPMLYVSHSLTEVVRIADHLVVMEEGVATATGAFREMLSRLDVAALSERPDAGVVVECLAGETDEAMHTTVLLFQGGALTVSGLQVKSGSFYRVRIAARDVAIALAMPIGASFQNMLPAVIRQLHHRQRGDVMLRLQVGDEFFLAAVTPAAVARLGLYEGLSVFALLKSVALAG